MLGREILAAKGSESVAVDVEDVYEDAAWVGFGIRWRKLGSLA